MLLVISIALAGLLGFAAQRASICTVKAVLEVFTSRRPFMLISFAKTVVWVVLITAALGWVVPIRPVAAWDLSLAAVVGGLLFGVGAAMNRGCAISTLSGLAAGQLSMLATIVGFAFGATCFLALTALGWTAPPRAGEALVAVTGAWSLALVAGLALWALWELGRLWRTRAKPAGLRALAASDRYRLSTAALLIGISNAVLFALYGVWPYTHLLSDGVKQTAGLTVISEPVHWILVGAVLAGMFLSAWQSGRFRLDWRPSGLWLARLGGGAFMGLGAAMVPGGNDVMILNGIPGFSPHALPAFIAMLAGISLVVLAMRVTGRPVEAIACSGDLCRVD